MRSDKNTSEQMASTLSTMYSSIEIPDGEAAWRQMQARLNQQYRRSHRRKIFRIGVAITVVSLILGTFLTTPKESYASMQSLFTMVKEARHGMVDIIFGEKRQANTDGAKTPPPPDMLGGGANPEQDAVSADSLNEIVQPEETTLEEAGRKLDVKFRVPKQVPNPFSLYRVRIFTGMDQGYHTGRIEYVNTDGEFFFITERKLAANSTGWKSSVNDSSGTIKEVQLNGYPGVIVLYTEGGVRLEWLWDDVVVEIYGELSEEQALDIARSMK